MPGRKPLDPDMKAKHRQETLRRYAEKNKEALREAARLRMQRLRAAAAASSITKAAMQRKARMSAAKYRERHRDAIREADTIRRAKKYMETGGVEAFDVKNARKFLARTQPTCCVETIGCATPRLLPTFAIGYATLASTRASRNAAPRFVVARARRDDIAGGTIASQQETPLQPPNSFGAIGAPTFPLAVTAPSPSPGHPVLVLIIIIIFILRRRFVVARARRDNIAGGNIASQETRPPKHLSRA
ncbi:hypothetical protein B0H11DRAFT_2231160 [Mycena galericulata]|nr:hypothetical protein B0H11DRAFT_2231160 [Mycena galericulata]